MTDKLDIPRTRLREIVNTIASFWGDNPDLTEEFETIYILLYFLEKCEDEIKEKAISRSNLLGRNKFKVIIGERKGPGKSRAPIHLVRTH